MFDPGNRSGQNQEQMCVWVTGHGHAAAPGPVLVLAQLTVQFGLGGGGCRGRQVRIAELPEEEGRRHRKLLLEPGGGEITHQTGSTVKIKDTKFLRSHRTLQNPGPVEPSSWMFIRSDCDMPTGQYGPEPLRTPTPDVKDQGGSEDKRSNPVPASWTCQLL